MGLEIKVKEIRWNDDIKQFEIVKFYKVKANINTFNY